MSVTLVTNIGELVTNDPSLGDESALGILRGGAVIFEGDRVRWVGRSSEARAAAEDLSDEPPRIIDAEHRAAIPGFVDSHTHLVFAGERSAEFSARMRGAPYTGGGIATTVAETHAASNDRLRAHTARLIAEMRASGTTTVEIKSGYGLNVVDEERLLTIASEFTAETTFLGAHVVPAEYAHDRAAYVDLVAGLMLDVCAPLSKWIDVFCDVGAFSEGEARHILQAGRRKGLGLRLHGNQLQHGPGVQLAVALDAASVDHCTYLNDEDIERLAASRTVATVLPAADFSTRAPYAPALRLLSAGVTVAIATDCNPGSSFVTSMPFCIALAVREMHLSPEEALLSATLGGAKALRRDDVGTLRSGCRADLAILDAPSHVHLAYRPGSSIVADTWVAGERVG